MISTTSKARIIGLLCLSLCIADGAVAESTCGTVRVAGGLPHRAGPPQATLEFLPASNSARPDYREVRPQNDVSGLRVFWLAQDGLVNAEDVESAEAVLDCDVPAVLLTFGDTAATRLERWSNANRGTLLAVLVDGRPITVASVLGTLGSKMALRLSNGNVDEAKTLANRLMGARRW